MGGGPCVTPKPSLKQDVAPKTTGRKKSRPASASTPATRFGCPAQTPHQEQPCPEVAPASSAKGTPQSVGAAEIASLPRRSPRLVTGRGFGSPFGQAAAPPVQASAAEPIQQGGPESQQPGSAAKAPGAVNGQRLTSEAAAERTSDAADVVVLSDSEDSGADENVVPGDDAESAGGNGVSGPASAPPALRSGPAKAAAPEGKSKSSGSFGSIKDFFPRIPREAQKLLWKPAPRSVPAPIAAALKPRAQQQQPRGRTSVPDWAAPKVAAASANPAVATSDGAPVQRIVGSVSGGCPAAGEEAGAIPGQCGLSGADVEGRPGAQDQPASSGAGAGHGAELAGPAVAGPHLEGGAAREGDSHAALPTTSSTGPTHGCIALSSGTTIPTSSFPAASLISLPRTPAPISGE